MTCLYWTKKIVCYTCCSLGLPPDPVSSLCASGSGTRPLKAQIYLCVCRAACESTSSSVCCLKSLWVWGQIFHNQMFSLSRTLLSLTDCRPHNNKLCNLAMMCMGPIQSFLRSENLFADFSDHWFLQGLLLTFWNHIFNVTKCAGLTLWLLVVWYVLMCKYADESISRTNILQENGEIHKEKKKEDAFWHHVHCFTKGEC